jgi:UPF0271 protein
LGALRAFADAHGRDFQHIKPHGALYPMLSDSETHARAVIEGAREVGPDLIYLATDMGPCTGSPRSTHWIRRSRGTST